MKNDDIASTASTSQQSSADWNKLEQEVSTGFENHVLRLIEGRERTSPYRLKRLRCSRMKKSDGGVAQCKKKTRYACNICHRAFCKGCSFIFHRYEIQKLLDK